MAEGSCDKRGRVRKQKAIRGSSSFMGFSTMCLSDWHKPGRGDFIPFSATSGHNRRRTDHGKGRASAVPPSCKVMSGFPPEGCRSTPRSAHLLSVEHRLLTTTAGIDERNRVINRLWQARHSVWE